MRRRRPRVAAVPPLPNLGRGSRERWLAAMRDWAEMHGERSDRWAEAHALLDEIEGFDLDADEAGRRLQALVRSWEAAS